MKLFARLVLTILSLAICRADMSEIETLFRSIVSQQDPSRVPKLQDLIGPVTGNNVLRDATPEQVERVLPLAAMCLESTNPAVRGHGMLLLSTVAAVRPDNVSLLAPYFEKVAPFLTDPEAGMKQAAIGVLAYGFPKPAKALVYLAAHLNDGLNSDTQFMMIAGALLVASPSDGNVVRSVLAALQKRPDHDLLAGAMIEGLGQQKITAEDALQFIRKGLTDKTAAVRRTAVDAVGNMPKDTRSFFAPDLQRILANSDEDPEVLARAREVLIQ